MKVGINLRHIQTETFSIHVDNGMKLSVPVGFYLPDSEHAAAHINILQEDIEIINLSLNNLESGQAVSWYIQDISLTAIPKDKTVNLTIRSKVLLFQQDLSIEVYRELVKLINENKQK